MTNPARHDEAGVSLLAGTRADRFAHALDGFFKTVQLAGLLTGERQGTAGPGSVLVFAFSLCYPLRMAGASPRLSWPSLTS